jgi:hypothetical protein
MGTVLRPFYSDTPMPEELTEADRRTLWEQFVDTYAKSQESYDNSVRTLAARGVAVTTSLATAIHALSPSGVTAVVFFLAGLAGTVASHVTAQRDMQCRLSCLRRDELAGIEGNRWTTATTALNIAAGVALFAGGVFLTIYIALHV